MKQYTMNLGGEDRVLDCGKMWFSEYLAEATGKDPIGLTPIQNTVNFIWAGIRCYAKTNNLAFDLTKEQLTEWVGNMEMGEITKLNNWYAPPTGEATAEAGNP